VCACVRAVCVLACVCACVPANVWCACVRACVWCACVRACVRACVWCACVRACVRACCAVRRCLCVCSCACVFIFHSLATESDCRGRRNGTVGLWSNSVVKLDHRFGPQKSTTEFDHRFDHLPFYLTSEFEHQMGTSFDCRVIQRVQPPNLTSEIDHRLDHRV
jgi:hypothetical protein